MNQDKTISELREYVDQNYHRGKDARFQVLHSLKLLSEVGRARHIAGINDTVINRIIAHCRRSGKSDHTAQMWLSGISAALSFAVKSGFITTRPTIKRIVANHRVSLRKNVIPKIGAISLDEATRMRESGVPVQEIATSAGVSKARVYAAMLHGKKVGEGAARRAIIETFDFAYQQCISGWIGTRDVSFLDAAISAIEARISVLTGSRGMARLG